MHTLSAFASYLGASDTGTIGLVGLTFKPNTDDLRESAAVRLLKRLCDLRKEVVVYEPEMAIDKMANNYLKSILSLLPEYPRLLVDLPMLKQRADTVLITRSGIVAAQDLATIGRQVIRCGPAPPSSMTVNSMWHSCDVIRQEYRDVAAAQFI